MDGSGSEVVIFEYADLQEGKDLSEKVAKAFGPGGLGLCAVRGVPGFQEARRKLLPLSRTLALLGEQKLERYELPETHYCVGWSRGREKFKGKPDTAKGSFYANPVFDDPANGDEEVRSKYPFAASKNVWPQEIPELEEAFKEMGRIVYDTAKPLVQQCDSLVEARHPGHGQRLYESAFTNSRMLLGRLLHYFAPSPDTLEDGQAWCGWHNDNSVITGLVPALWMVENTGEELPSAPDGSDGGLYVRSRDRAVEKVTLPADCIGYQIGEASQIMSAGLLVATPHQVRSHKAAAGGAPISREAFALFIEPQWDASIGPPGGANVKDILENEETELIPPLSKRLQLNQHDNTVLFGDYLANSIKFYYEHSNS